MGGLRSSGRGGGVSPGYTFVHALALGLVLGLWLFVAQAGLNQMSQMEEDSPRRLLREQAHASTSKPSADTVARPKHLPTVAQHPPMLYGTAWKKERTRELVELALAQGFRGVDTANQPRHYTEAAVGEAVANAIAAGVVTREQLFLQTKFTHPNGQDPNNCPYDQSLPAAEQVRRSFALSLEHLQTAYVDSYVLHGPSVGGSELGPKDWEVWRAMEKFHPTHARHLGISNVNIDQLQELWEKATVKPSFVQNRCYAKFGWDLTVRQFCRTNGIVYQGFSLLTANPDALRDERIAEIGRRRQMTPSQVVFQYAHQVGMLPLTGTTSKLHMQQDLRAVSESVELRGDEVIHVETAFMDIPKEQKGDDD